ncbi:MAG: hypothetical protein R2824_31825 [Saprospiraceae bacterium]
MKLRKYPSLSRAADALSKQGFTARFALEDKQLIQVNEGRIYRPEDVAIVEYHRFLPEGTDIGKIAIVFALETIDGIKGLLVAFYNAYGKVNLLEFMDRVKIKARKKIS